LYADAVLELLDPHRAYFGSRVIAADEEHDAGAAKRLVSGLEGREPIAVIVDDSMAVWPHDRRNLFVVERYIYFPSSQERFGLQGLSLLEIDRCARGLHQGVQAGGEGLDDRSCVRGLRADVPYRLQRHRCCRCQSSRVNTSCAAAHPPTRPPAGTSAPCRAC
jgi:hypothetical protein